jgi:phosphoglycerol transferase MdoB-like AlkP superfamily enzyme
MRTGDSFFRHPVAVILLALGAIFGILTIAVWLVGVAMPLLGMSSSGWNISDAVALTCVAIFFWILLLILVLVKKYHNKKAQ